MKTFACYCQKCKAANTPGEELCASCGTPLMLVVTPPATKNETIWSDAYPPEHLLERISLLELRLMQVTDRLSQALDLMLRQSKTIQSEHLLVETLFDALTASGVIESGKLSNLWQEKKKSEERQIKTEIRREKILAQIAAGAKTDLFAQLVKDGFRLLQNGEEKSALRTLERAAATEKENFALLFFIGENFFRLDWRAQAREYLERAHRAAPRNAAARLLLSVILADEGETKGAKRLLENLPEKNFAANFVLGMIEAAESRLAETLTFFKKALTALPCAETHYLVGSACAELRRDKTARRHFQKAVEADANFADAWFMLGTISIRLGDEAGGKDALQQALLARDAAAQSHAVLRNPKKYPELGTLVLLFARLDNSRKNLVSGASPRLAKLLREEIEKLSSR